jgi:exosome complex exonuclease DIS3/RRP44
VKSGTVGGRQTVFFYPLDRKIPRIKLQTRQAQQLVGKRVVVSIDSWEKNNMHPSGHFVRCIGDIGEKGTETEVLLLEHDVPFQPFSQEVLADLPEEGENWKVKIEDLAVRRDLRHLDICSIDPPGMNLETLM